MIKIYDDHETDIGEVCQNRGSLCTAVDVAKVLEVARQN